MLATLGKSEVSSRLEVQDKGGTFKVLEPAILPIRPVSPNRIIIIAFALVAGIGAGIGFVILMDNMDKSVKNVDTANTFGLPVLAVLPYVRLAHEVRWTKVKNFMLFAFTVIYLACVAALLTFEVVKVIS
jgi:capsular polysaccharide biosynthesis protein